MMIYHFPPVAVSRRLIVSLVIAVGVALSIAVLRSTPVFIDTIASAVGWISTAPLELFLVVPLLIATIAAGAWATFKGVSTQVKRTRKSKRRRARSY